MINAKSAKALRRFLRKTDLDFRASQYQVKIVKRVLVNVNGVMTPQNRLQVRLNPESGRAVYRRLKPLWA